MQASGPAASGAAEGILGQALGRLFAVAEAYPQLRATENFQQLQAELTNTEDQISASRRIYNGNVQSYNTKIQTFPNSVIAGFGGFTKREFFEIETPADREPVRVSFSDPPSVAATPDPAPDHPGRSDRRPRIRRRRARSPMPHVLVFGARNLGRVIAEHLMARGWTATGVARTQDTVDAFPGNGSLPTPPSSTRCAVRSTRPATSTWRSTPSRRRAGSAAAT